MHTEIDEQSELNLVKLTTSSVNSNPLNFENGPETVVRSKPESKQTTKVIQPSKPSTEMSEKRTVVLKKTSVSDISDNPLKKLGGSLRNMRTTSNLN